jgi:CheY-like chemotaxis protein
MEKGLMIVLMEDDREIASLYSKVLENRGHTVTITHLAEECLQIYSDKLEESYTKKPEISDVRQFDAVILDYKKPDRNGLEVAKEILTINTHQRIIIVSAYLESVLIESIKKLGMPIEILEKPISNRKLVDTIEDTETYEELKNLKFDIEIFRNAGMSHELLKKILDILKKKDKDT